MKRKGNLYENIYKLENIHEAFDEVCMNITNRNKAYLYKSYRGVYVARIYEVLKNREYEVGPYNEFIIREPKERKIVSQNLHDKIINHLIARHILLPSICNCLIDTNIASRKGYGTNTGWELNRKYRQRYAVKYKKYYILKFDISKFFTSIDKDRLKDKLKRRIKDEEALNIVFKVIDSQEDGIGIGNMTSQLLAIFYLNDLDHFIKEELKIKSYIRYQDDGLLFCESKEYLKHCLERIIEFLAEEKLELNRKTRIYKYTDNYVYLGRNNRGKYARYRVLYRKLRRNKFLYKTGQTTLYRYVCSTNSFRYLNKRI